MKATVEQPNCHNDHHYAQNPHDQPDQFDSSDRNSNYPIMKGIFRKIINRQDHHDHHWAHCDDQDDHRDQSSQTSVAVSCEPKRHIWQH